MKVDEEVNNPKHEEEEKICAVVGRLMLTMAALDNQLNKILVTILVSRDSAMVETLAASLDATRKVEILRGFAKHIPETWRKGLADHLDLIEKVNRMRNIAAHSTLIKVNGEPVLFSFATAKMFKAIDLESGTAKNTSLKELAEAIATGERAVASGVNVLANFETAARKRELGRASKVKTD